MSTEKLPEGWVKTNLENIASWGSGGTPSRSHDEFYNGNIPWIKTGDLGPKLITKASEYITDDGVKNSSAKYFPKGSVAIAMYGATIGKTSILGIDATTNQACAVGIPLEGLTSSFFLYYFLLNEKNAFIKKGKGGAQPNISQGVIKEHTICLPPFSEQKIIVEKLDTLLAQVDSTKARLEQIPQILKRFRQGVLTAAVNGKLTDEWRKLTGLHAMWTSHTLGELVTIDRGSSPRPIKDYITTSENGVNWIKIGDTREGEKYIRSTKEKITKEGSKKSRKVIPGDFILSNSMSLGRAYIVEIEGCVHDGWFILRLPENIDKNYFYYLLSSSQLQAQFSSLAVGGVVQNIRSELVKQAIVNIPPEKEQHEIVRRVEQLFAYADTIEKQVNNALARVNNLTQSILAKAFRGELSAQWRAENPDLISGENSAAALLEKIKAERAASGSKKSSRKKI